MDLNLSLFFRKDLLEVKAKRWEDGQAEGSSVRERNTSQWGRGEWICFSGIKYLNICFSGISYWICISTLACFNLSMVRLLTPPACPWAPGLKVSGPALASGFLSASLAASPLPSTPSTSRFLDCVGKLHSPFQLFAGLYTIGNLMAIGRFTLAIADVEVKSTPS